MVDISRFTDRARKVLSIADTHAATRKFMSVPPNCLLLAILECDCIAKTALINLGVRDKIYDIVKPVLGPTFEDQKNVERLKKFTTESERVLEFAIECARKRTASTAYHVGTEEILLAIVHHHWGLFNGLITEGAIVEEVTRLIAGQQTVPTIETGETLTVKSEIVRFFSRDGTAACTRSIWARYDWRDGQWELRIYSDKGLRDAYDLGKPAKAISADVADLVIKAVKKLGMMLSPPPEFDHGKHQQSQELTIMASFNGLRYTTELLGKGWKIHAEENTGEEMRDGDPHLIDPVTGKIYLPYEAITVQLDREKADADRALEMREKR